MMKYPKDKTSICPSFTAVTIPSQLNMLHSFHCDVLEQGISLTISSFSNLKVIFAELPLRRALHTSKIDGSRVPSS